MDRAIWLSDGHILNSQQRSSTSQYRPSTLGSEHGSTAHHPHRRRHTRKVKIRIDQGMDPTDLEKDRQNENENGNERGRWGKLKHHLNFFRVHILVFTFTPIIVSCIFYAANGSASGNANSMQTGRQKVTYIDSLFLCFSAMTTCGLVTVNLSAIFPFQQVLLFLLFVIGDPTFVALIMVLTRKRYFRTHCEQLLVNYKLHRTQTLHPEPTVAAKAGQGFNLNTFLAEKTKRSRAEEGRREKKGMMISGPIGGHKLGGFVEDQEDDRAQVDRGITDSPVEMTTEAYTEDSRAGDRSQFSTLGHSTAPLIKPAGENGSFGSVSPAQSTRGYTTALPSSGMGHPHVHAHETTFAARQRLRQQTRANTLRLGPTATINIGSLDHPHPSPAAFPQPPRSNIPLAHMPTSPVTMTTVATRIPRPLGHKDTGYGGFPTPLELIRDLFPEKAKDKLARPVRKLELVTHPTFAPALEARHGRHEESWSEAIKGSVAKWVPEGLGGLVIGRNSRFWTEELDDEELEQIGGVEYRGLRLLSYLVAGYMFLCQAIPFAILAIYFAKVHRWDSAFDPDQGVQAGQANKTWASLFVVVSGYTGTGMSLIDQGLAPFSNSYTLIYVLVFVLLSGNHALPIMLRFVIWLGTKATRKGTLFETLHFLLDHPRRCFLYLFPSHQTWYLVFILLAFVVIELFGFLVLNIGLPVLDSLTGWQRFSDGMLQSLSVRASGFGIVSLANMAPSVLFLYIILMYVAIYPIAMSVRSTNVYEERALGVYEHEDPETLSDDEPEFKGRRHEVFSKYLLWHMRKQLAFDIWPLALAVFVICCLERGKVMDPDKAIWFNVFRILFECTSAYSVIGLSLGTPNNNYSFAGELGTASKIVLIMVMLRGRHRGLPVAIDRAILLPTEYSRIVKQANDTGTDEKGAPETTATSARNPFAVASREDDRSRPIEIALDRLA